MPTYRVELPVEGFELYLVEADTPEEAADNWLDGDLINSEVSAAGEAQVLGIEEED